MTDIIIWSVGVVILMIIIYLIFSRSKHDLKELDGKMWFERWQQIEKFLDSKNNNDWRMAVIEADKFLDNILKHKGLGGNTLGERLKIAQAKFHGLSQVWPAHLLRNKLVHESDYNLKHSQAKHAIKDFKQALKRLGYNNF